MKKMLFFILCVIVFPVFAIVDLSNLLNKVSFDLTAEEWVTTKTAEVHVTVNAAISDNNIGNIQMNVMEKLKQLTPLNEWHIVSFNRHQDQSGLENIIILAQNRLPAEALSGLRDKAKEISVAGEKYTISDVQFIPSDDEIKTAMIKLRDNIYMQAKNEIENLNKLYPNQKFYLYQINFNFFPMEPSPLAANVMALAKTREVSAPLTVGNKITLRASVIIAALPQEVLKDLHAN